jgi:hypothetical protein
MLRHLDFHCTECGTTNEEFVDHTVEEVPCECGSTARRILTAVRIDRSAIALTLGASPESIAHFDRLHQQRKTIEERTFKEHGDYGKAPGSD